MRTLKRVVDKILTSTGLQYWPVTVKGGMAAGARWTLYPGSAYWRGTFESKLQSAILRFGPVEGECCWDLGAHFGLFTIGFAKAVGPSGQVGSFEPDPVSSARCQRHIRMNGTSWVRHWTAAVSEFDGEQELILSQGKGATTSHLAYEGEYNTPFATVQVKKVRLDDLVSNGELRLPRLVKVDVEGHAAPALRGARSDCHGSTDTVHQLPQPARDCRHTRCSRIAWLHGRLVGWQTLRVGRHPMRIGTDLHGVIIFSVMSSSAELLITRISRG